MPPDTIASLLAEGQSRIAASGSASPLLDARLLLQHATGLSREDMILDPGRTVATAAADHFRRMIRRREGREPVSRILGGREFYGRMFTVTPDVLDPRPDTEALIDAALAIMEPGCRILDLGTGSGAIAITLLAERPDATGVATDVSAAALAVAQENARSLGVADRLGFALGPWFEPVTGRFGLIVSNPPYIRHDEIASLAPDVRDFDPHAALDGGPDGLAPYRHIARDAGRFLTGGGRVLVEIGAGQANDVAAIFAACGFQEAVRRLDLGGHVRCLGFHQA